LGYVGILALILVLVGAVAVWSFSQQMNAQQDQLLEQKAEGASDFTQGLLRQYQEGEPPHGPSGPIQASTASDIGVVALVPADSSAGGGQGGSKVLDSSPSSSSFGLPFEEPAQRAAQQGETIKENIAGPEGEEERVVSVPVSGSGGQAVVVQAAQSRQVVWQSIDGLVRILIPVGLGALLLAGVGGLYMSRRAMRPVRDAFDRQRTFVADASHELKTPLTLIRADAEVLSRSLGSPDDTELAQDLLKEADRMNALLSDLLTLARLDAGKLAVCREVFDLTAVVAEAADRFGTRAEAENITLDVEAPGEKLLARGDVERSGQILAALLDNALRFASTGGRVEVGIRARDGRVEVSVADTGPGIPPEHLGRIFDRFYRAEEARTRAGGGTGLGLAIARDLARAQGGDLTAGSSAKNGGASFILWLPAGA
jgi:signal transduction histidine kinase